MDLPTPSEARELLQFHSCRHVETHPKRGQGFLGSLRPFSGLRDENFHQVMRCLKVLAPELVAAETCDKEVISALWSIVHLGRAWGVESSGMLRANSLISAADVERLDSWINQISYATFCLFEGVGIDTAFEFYDHEYIAILKDGDS